MSDYITKELDNQYHDISYDDIRKLYRENLREQREGERITADSYQGNYKYPEKNGQYEFERDILLRDPKTAGFRMQYPHGIVLEQSMRRSYFRGENCIYPSSVPSLLRKLRQFYTVREKELYRMVADMRVAEFKALLQKFDHVIKWNYCDILYDVLAQHYGLETGWLDITNDFNVALFFATCYYDSGSHLWKPLTRVQTETEESRKYGVIFHMPGNRATMKLQLAAGEYAVYPDKPRTFVHDRNAIFPIGFQPFMRCHMQYGYGIYMRREAPLQSDRDFEKLRFRHNEKLSKAVYDMMEGGRLIYPQEGLTQIEFVIDQIRTAASFSEESFQYALERSHFYKCSEADRCRKDLSNFIVDGRFIEITEKHPWHLSGLRKRKINERYKDFTLEAKYGIQALSRTVLPGGGAPMLAPWMIAEDDSYQGVYDMQPRSPEGYSLWDRQAVELLSMVKYAKLMDF